MKKRLALLAVAVALVAFAAVGGSLAYTQVTGSAVDTQINTKTLSIALNSADASVKKSVTLKGAVPGDSIGKDISVTNSADTTLYTRVTIQKAWKADDLDASLLTFDVNKSGDWIVIDNGESIVLYYTKPLAAGQSTDSALSAVKISKDADNSYTDQTVELSVTADAVQSYDAATAMMSAWGVSAGFDGNGILTSVTE